jgi:hypothetical protein
MQRAILTVLVAVHVLACSAAQSPEGRWEGVILIPDRELPFVVDLARDRGGAWAGSIIIPGLGIKGAALSNIAVTDTGMTFAVAGSLASTKHGPASFVARLAQDSIAGQMSQAGNTAEFLLRRMGPAQVEPPPRSTPVRVDLEDRWTGEFELGGYPRHVTITFENRADTGATARFVIVGKQTTLVPVDLVIQDGDFVKLESATTRITFEGRYVRDTGQIRGVIELGAIELPLVLRRAAGSAS